MAEALEVQKNRVQDVQFVFLHGSITEDSVLDSIESGGAKTMVIDLAKVTRINSYGIRQWINHLKKIHETTPNLVFTRCPPSIVEQFNMISNFGADGVVYSFYLPFYSESQDKDELVLFDAGSNPGMGYEEIIASCVSRLDPAAKFVFNDIEDEYFSFLQLQKSKTLSPEIAALIQQHCV